MGLRWAPQRTRSLAGSYDSLVQHLPPFFLYLCPAASHTENLILAPCHCALESLGLPYRMDSKHSDLETGLVSPMLLSRTHFQDALFPIPILQSIHSQAMEAGLSHLRLHQHLLLPTTIRGVDPGLGIYREARDNPPLHIWAFLCSRVLDKSAE